MLPTERKLHRLQHRTAVSIDETAIFLLLVSSPSTDIWRIFDTLTKNGNSEFIAISFRLQVDDVPDGCAPGIWNCAPNLTDSHESTMTFSFN